MTEQRILLSPPHLGDLERTHVLAALDSNWVAPAGPDLAAFQEEVASYVGRAYGVALSSGTAALHLLLASLDVGPGDLVVVPTLTFAATANAVLYTGAEPVFVDCSPDTWTVDPSLVAEVLASHAGRVRAVLAVDLYGQCADYDALTKTCEAHDAVLLEDAAEGLGATYGDQPAGSFGLAAALSFNGNKMITTGGGGMVVTDDAALADHVRYLSTQARDDVPHYEHQVVGYNYRLSNVLAAIGRGQMAVLEDRVAARHRVNGLYREALADVPGVTFMPEAAYGRPSWWLTSVLIDPDAFGADRDQVRLHLEANAIEARPTWKPMHQQPAYRAYRTCGTRHADAVFARGLCLPSGSSLTDAEIEHVVESVLSTPGRDRARR